MSETTDLPANLSLANPGAQAQGPWTDIALHTLGWKAFQDLSAQVCEEIIKMPVEIYREAGDGGQDAAFLARSRNGKRLATPAVVQCKFTSKSNKNFGLSDLRHEEENIVKLRAEHSVNAYIVMTNMSVSGVIALDVKKRLRELGVNEPEIYGKEFLTNTIRSSARLRSLVPRIYGLGDLSTILDERVAAQTKALLGHMLPTLSVYVPTTPHIHAVNTLAKHHIVLLLGDPATGKSTLAALLATTASEQVGRSCYKSEGPSQLLASWNPNDPAAFFWMDDAFGPNQLREDFIDTWIGIMPKVQAAVAAGSQVVLTSRRHIYEAAKHKLGSRNHPLFKNEEAIVSVGDLSLSERQQILYNHIKAGNQSTHWKCRVKPQLNSLATEPGFIPEIARRLGDEAYTRKVSTSNDSLLRFIREPKEHLIETIQELSQLHRAALTLVFLHRSQMPVSGPVLDMQDLVRRHHSIDLESLGQALDQLNNSFLIQIELNGKLNWSFKHPTIADAISAILGRSYGLCELYLRGTKSETIMAEAVCVGKTSLRDAIPVPPALNTVLAERLAEIPDEPSLNRQLFSFLTERASDEFFRLFVGQHPEILTRKAPIPYRVRWDPRLRAMARAHRMGVLSDELRFDIGTQLQTVLLDRNDLSFLNDDDLLSLIKPTELLQLPAKIRSQILAEIPNMAEAQADDADLDLDARDNFEEILSIYSELEEFFADDPLSEDLMCEAQTAIDDGMATITKKIEDKENEEERRRLDDQGEDDEWNWQNQVPAISAQADERKNAPRLTSARSIFSDVDE